LSLESRIIGLEERVGQAELVIQSPAIDVSQIVTGTLSIDRGGTGETTIGGVVTTFIVPLLPWGIGDGGTGADTASAARENLAVPKITVDTITDPNVGPLGGISGDLYLDSSTPALWYCHTTDAWTLVGSGSTGTTVYRGRVDLSSGTATVSVNPFDTVNDRIVLCPNDSNGTAPAGFVWAANFVADTSFDIISSDSGDKNAVDWYLIQGGDVFPSGV
jgi:hypothetical protein